MKVFIVTIRDDKSCYPDGAKIDEVYSSLEMAQGRMRELFKSRESDYPDDTKMVGSYILTKSESHIGVRSGEDVLQVAIEEHKVYGNVV